MIITKKIKINITNRNIKKYINIPNIEIGEIEIPVEYLLKGSHTKIIAKCDICGKERNIPYRQYLSSNNNQNYYCCSPNCAQNKNKKTNRDKYGVDSASKLEKIKNKVKLTCLKKYGVDSYLKTKEKQEKSEITCLKKYGVKSSNNSKIVKNNKKKSFIKKYGVENPSQLESIKKIKKQIYINSHIKKYGILPDERNLLVREYRNEVKNLTKKVKKELLENWNGYDFYDNEYIKDNFNLDPTHKNYPTIDHKISVYYGFNNNIPSKEISKLDNLCFTKRTLNSIKNKKCYEEKDKN